MQLANENGNSSLTLQSVACNLQFVSRTGKCSAYANAARKRKPQTQKVIRMYNSNDATPSPQMQKLISQETRIEAAKTPKEAGIENIPVGMSRVLNLNEYSESALRAHVSRLNKKMENGEFLRTLKHKEHNLLEIYKGKNEV